VSGPPPAADGALILHLVCIHIHLNSKQKKEQKSKTYPGYSAGPTTRIFPQLTEPWYCILCTYIYTQNHNWKTRQKKTTKHTQVIVPGPPPESSSSSGSSCMAALHRTTRIPSFGTISRPTSTSSMPEHICMCVCASVYVYLCMHARVYVEA
jgi:hypothetical protein